MRWLKRDLWKTGIVITDMLLFLMLIAWVPVSAATTHEVALGFVTPVTLQATPTVDATLTALNKAKLEQEVQQLKEQNEPNLFGWLRTNAAILLSTLVVVIGGLIGLFRWFGDRRSEREKRAEERFQSVVTGLGDEKEGARIGAAILLRTFLRPGYEQFYTQTFDLAVANLRLPRTPHLSEDPDGTAHSPEDPNTVLSLTTLSQALIVVFKEAFPLARRNQEKRSSQSLDATGIQLDNAYLRGADLKLAWMPQASLRKANLSFADLSGAKLSGADLRFANLRFANLSFTNLRGAKLSGADLDARLLKGADLRGVEGLTQELLATYKAKGATIDEDPSTSSSQSTVSTSLPSQSNDVQAKPDPSAQGSTPPPDPGGSSTVSPQQELGS